MTKETVNQLIEWAVKYNDPLYFKEDPIAFPTKFRDKYRRGKADLRDIEISGIFAAHFAWGRRAMIVRDCGRLFDEMDWKPRRPRTTAQSSAAGSPLDSSAVPVAGVNCLPHLLQRNRLTPAGDVPSAKNVRDPQRGQRRVAAPFTSTVSFRPSSGRWWCS